MKAARGRKVSEPTSLPAPVGGWNARDPISAMDSRFAVTMENWWPTTRDVQVRKGIANHLTGMTGQAESLMVYNKQDGTQTMFVAANSAFYNATTAGAVGAAVVSSLTNNRWQHVNYTTSSSSWLCCFNSTDSPRFWDGATWTTITGASTPAITGVTTTTLDSPWVHKRRMWMVQKNTLTVWYLPVDAVGGAATAFDFYGIAQYGGKIVAGGTWTLDGGDGPDDYFVVITSEGEIIVYAGTDPISSSTWQLVGTWKVGEPIGARCLFKFQGDLLVICRDGVYPLSRLMLTSGTDKSVAVTNNIQEAMTTAGALYKANYGWQLMFYPEASMLILNVPVAAGSLQEQYCMNTITGSWCKFKDISANCWAIFNGQPYYGGSTVVGKLWGTFADNATNITATLEQAFSYLGKRGLQKTVKAARPVISTNGNPSVEIGANSNFRLGGATDPISFTATSFAVWDTGVWDAAVFGGGLNIADNWQTIFAQGTSIGPIVKCATNGLEVRLQATDYLYEVGNVIS